MILPLALKELKSSFLDWRFLGTILLSFAATLFITGVLINSVGSFSEGNIVSSLPISNKLVKIAVVENGYHPSVEQLANSTSAYVIRADQRAAERMLLAGEVHAIYIVNETSGRFIGSGDKPVSALAELSVKEAVDKVVRPDKSSKYNFNDDTGLEDLVRSLLTPILLFSPVFLWGLPIIQSVAYDRENRVLEVLFSAPIDRRKILLSKVLANMLFIAIVGALWVAVVYAYGFRFFNPVGVFLVLLSVTFLMVCMNALVSSISRNVQEATLASSISSTLIFTGLFLITMLNVVPQSPILVALSDLSPATYVAKQLTADSAFPAYPVLTILIMAFSALVLALAAFSAEAFAFSVKPGIRQLYEGMEEILGRGVLATAGMGFVAFSLTTPVQLVLLGLVAFSFGQFLPVVFMAFLLIIIMGMTEEVLKGIGIYVLKPKNALEGAALGAMVGLFFGIGEALLLLPLLMRLGEASLMRVVAILVHVACSAIAGAGYGLGNWVMNAEEREIEALRGWALVGGPLASFLLFAHRRRKNVALGLGAGAAFGLAGILAASLLHGLYNGFFLGVAAFGWRPQFLKFLGI